MKRLDELYSFVLVFEALKKFNLSEKDVRALLDQAYKEVNQRNPEARPQKRREGEELPLAPILLTLYHLQDDYNKIFLNYAKNPKAMLKALIQKDEYWSSEYDGANKRLQIWLRQGGKLVFGDILKRLGLNNYTVATNEAGQPVYKFHMLHKYIQMNLLAELFAAKKIDEATKKQLEGIVFNDQTKQQFAQEILNYYGKPVPVEEKEPISADPHTEPDYSSTEVEPKEPALSPEEMAREKRLELIKQRANLMK
jgi:hypothetical protein